MSRYASQPPAHRAAPTGTGLEIHVLGPLDVRVEGSPLVVDTRKALAILVLLAVERRPFAREELGAMLWPESDDESARGALRRTLSVLRSALGDRWIGVDRSTVSLDDQGLWTDLSALETAAGGGDAADLAAAADLARGSFLAGFSLRDSSDFDDWRATRAVAIERSVVAILDRLAATAASRGDLATAVGAATRRVDLDPLDEGAHQRLMLLLARGGDRSGAIRQYRTCVAILERELGVAPLAETTSLYEAVRDARPTATFEGGTDPGADRPGRLRPVPFPLVGRDEELRRLLEAHEASGRDGSVVAITGEAGIGKTRLAEEVADAVAGLGARVLSARAFASEGGIAYAPIAELLRAGFAMPDAADRIASLPAATLEEVARLTALPEVQGRARARSQTRTEAPAFPDPQTARARLVEAVATTLTALVAGSRTGLLVVEDLHWADDASREALLYLGRRMAGRSALLVLTWRPEDLDELGTAFATAVEALRRTTVVALRRLDREAVGRLAAAAVDAGVAASPMDADELLAASEGLPLYAVEALAVGTPAGEGPARSIRALLSGRLASVGETAGQVLSAAAVIGRSFDLSLVRAASGRTEDETITALEELVRRAIVREVQGRGSITFDFAHARLRDAAYESTGLARRRLLHRRTAELLRADPAGRDDPGRLAQLAIHERAAGRDAAAAEAFREAGLRERALYANREAALHLETALALGHPDVVGIQLALGEIRTAQGDYAAAIAALEAVAAIGHEGLLPAIELRLGRVHARRGDLGAAASHLEAAIEELRPGGDAAAGALLVQALVERSVVALRAHDLERAEAAATRALVAAGGTGPTGDPGGLGAAHRLLGLVARERGDLPAAEVALRRSLDLAALDPDPATAIAAGNALALTLAGAGDHAAAIGLLTTALEACRRTGERHLQAAVENNLADQLHAAGRSDEAMDHLKRAVATFAEVGGGPGELEPEIWKLVTW